MKNTYSEEGWIRPYGKGSDFQILTDGINLPAHLKEDYGQLTSGSSAFRVYVKKHVEEYFTDEDSILITYITIDMGARHIHMRVTP